MGVTPYTEIPKIVSDCEVLFLGVKPQIFSDILPKIAIGLKAAGTAAKGKLIVSMAAGISIASIAEVLGADTKIVRIMPNTPAQVGAGMTSVSRNELVSDSELDFLMNIFSGIGLAVEVPENMIHTVIGISGSSPAYTFLYINSLIDEAVREGMTPESAKVFAAQAVLGAAKMVLETNLDPIALCKNVCSPGGTTIEAVKILEQDGLDDLISRAFKACTDKSRLLNGENRSLKPIED